MDNFNKTYNYIKVFVEETSAKLSNNEVIVNTNLSNSFKVVNINNNGGEIIMPIYGLVIDEGRKPNSSPPPIDVIERWAVKKNIPKELSYIIAKSIGKKGIKAKPFIEDALEFQSTSIDNDKRLYDAIEADISNIFGV